MCVNVWQLPVQVDQVTVLVGQVAVPLRVPVTVQVGVEVAVQVGGGGYRLVCWFFSKF